MIDSPLTVGVMAEELTKVFLAVKEQIPSPSVLAGPPQQKMMEFLVEMMKRAMAFIDKEGEKLPRDEFQLQYRNIVLAVDKSKVAIYYTKGFSFPLNYLSPEDTKGVIELAS